jgi:hypothetical protein
MSSKFCIAKHAELVAFGVVSGAFATELVPFIKGAKVLHAIDPVLAVPFGVSVSLLLFGQCLTMCVLVFASSRTVKAAALAFLAAALAAYNVALQLLHSPSPCPCFGTLFDALPVLAPYKEWMKVSFILALFVIARIITLYGVCEGHSHLLKATE